MIFSFWHGFYQFERAIFYFVFEFCGSPGTDILIVRTANLNQFELGIFQFVRHFPQVPIQFERGFFSICFSISVVCFQAVFNLILPHGIGSIPNPAVQQLILKFHPHNLTRLKQTAKTNWKMLGLTQRGTCWQCAKNRIFHQIPIPTWMKPFFFFFKWDLEFSPKVGIWDLKNAKLDLPALCKNLALNIFVQVGKGTVSYGSVPKLECRPPKFGI